MQLRLVTVHICLILFCVSCGSQPSTVGRATEPKASDQTRALSDDLQGTLTYLASDELEGRGAGTRGLDRAAEYIATRFERAGLLAPASDSGYFQPFSLSTAVRVDPQTYLSVGFEHATLDDDFRPLSFSALQAFAGEVVFVGYGISSAQHAYDDYADVDVKGKIVLIMRYEPHDAAGRSRFIGEGWSTEATLPNKAKVAADHGALAVLFVTPPVYHAPDALMPFIAQPGIARSTIPLLHVQQGVAEQLLKTAHLPALRELQARIDTTGKPASLALGSARISGRVRLTDSSVDVKNVIGILPGKGDRADEYIVVGAHYDHWGHGGWGALPATVPADRDTIWNGADDNASGTTALLALADVLSRDVARDRSIIFAAFAGEEWGLVGSNRFVAQPPVELGQIRAMINLDMVGRVQNDSIFIMGAGTAKPFNAIIEEASKHTPLKINSKSQGGLGPSDQMSFAMKRIPVLFFFSGVHADYHRPSDEVARINFVGLQQAVDLAAHITRAVAQMPDAEYVSAYDATSSFLSTGSAGSRVMLGVMPSYGTTQPGTGVTIAGTVPGSPADKAGLKSGDIIVGLGDAKIDGLEDLSQALATAKVGDEVAVRVLRDQQTLELRATLVKRGN